MKADEQPRQRCESCGKIITEEEYITNFESRGEFWGAPCSEEVVIGYHCKECGYRGDF